LRSRHALTNAVNPASPRGLDGSGVSSIGASCTTAELLGNGRCPGLPRRRFCSVGFFGFGMIHLTSQKFD
jgi:hypothetical protein